MQKSIIVGAVAVGVALVSYFFKVDIREYVCAEQSQSVSQ